MRESEYAMKAADIFNLAGRVALVTGASSGLGARFADVLAANGAAVALVARRVERLEDARARIQKAGGHAVAIEADVTDRAAVARAFDAAEKAFGTVTILVNNAGVAHTTRAVEITADEYRRVVGTNLDAVFAVAQEAARRMLAANKPGAIVNIASVLGFGVSKGTAAYAIAKAGVVQMTKALALELTFKGIRVNAIAPGWFVTEINHDFLMSEEGRKMTRDIPAGRFGKDGDLDGALLLLASDAGSFISGATIVADGGPRGGVRGEDRGAVIATSRQATKQFPSDLCGGPPLTYPSAAAVAAARMPSRFVIVSRAIMPAIIAATNAKTCGDSVARFSIAGPGHRPVRPQPTPNSAAPATRLRSTTPSAGQKLLSANNGRARLRANA
jgi:NAD(P)-dependent dehydrogenase (short-subunit alcohol dehydrogenase family)